MHVHRIQIICNTLHVKLDTSPKKVPKYKKVGKKAKQELLDLVEAGCSIVAVHLVLFRPPISLTSIILQPNPLYNITKNPTLSPKSSPTPRMRVQIRIQENRSLKLTSNTEMIVTTSFISLKSSFNEPYYNRIIIDIY